MNLVHQYGVLAPIDGAELVEHQLRLAWEYRKKLVELERERRAELRKVYEANGNVEVAKASVLAAQEALEAAVVVVSRQRAKTRTKSETPEMAETVKLARAALKTAKAMLRDARRIFRESPDAQAKVDAVNETASARRRTMGRAEFGKDGRGLRHGTYTLIEDADEQARKVKLYDGADPNDPRWPRWDGGGRIGVQVQGGVDIATLFGGQDTFLRVTRQEPNGKRVGRKDLRLLWLRVGSNADRSPVWSVFPMVFHRPFPVGATIMRVNVRKKRVGPGWRWTVDFVLRTPDYVLDPKPGIVAIDVGWRKLRHGIRIAAIATDDGKHEEILLPDSIAESLRKPEELRAIRDKHFDEAKASLQAFLASMPDVPAWLTERTEHIDKWRSPARLVSLGHTWREARFAGDEAIWRRLFDAANVLLIHGPVRSRRERIDWLGKDRHLWQWECDAREHSLKLRQNYYRALIAAPLAEKYGTVVFEEFDLSRIARRKEKTEPGHENETARSNRHLVAVSAFRDAIMHAFRKRGGVVGHVPAEASTKECHVCGEVTEFDAATLLVSQCPKCGEWWDQDDNAAQNILQRWQRGERSSDGKKPASARVDGNGNESEVEGGSRRARSKAAAAKRKGRLDTARKAGDKAAE